jgi:hypothetical protein
LHDAKLRSQTAIVIEQGVLGFQISMDHIPAVHLSDLVEIMLSNVFIEMVLVFNKIEEVAAAHRIKDEKEAIGSLEGRMKPG